jgi:hypothetical protein
MAKFTRAEIRAILGEAHTDDIENRLIALHLGVVDPLKDQLQTYKADAEKLPGVQKELDDLKTAGDGGYKEKYEAEAEAHKTYRQPVETEKANASKTTAVRAALKAAGVNRDEFADLLLGKVDLSKVELVGDKVKDADGLIAPLKGSYAGCFGTVTDNGTPPANPPAGPSKMYTREEIRKMSPVEINKNWDAVQKSLASIK